MICLTIINAASATPIPITLAKAYFFAVATPLASPAADMYIKPETTSASIAMIPTVDNMNVNIFIRIEAKLGASEIAPEANTGVMKKDIFCPITEVYLMNQDRS